jgi:quinol monooxygenase YgiN
MSKVALYVPLEAKPGKEKEVADFLKSALPLVNAEPGTVTWFAIQEGPSSFAIFDTFNDEAGRDAHLNGKVAAALCTENLNPNVLTMKSAQYRARIYDAGSLNLARDRRILVQ